MINQKAWICPRGPQVLPPAVDEPGGSDSRAGDKRQGDEGVGDAAMMFEGLDLARKSPEDVEVGGLGGEHGSQGRECGFSIEAGAADAGADKEMRDGFHALETIVAEIASLRGLAMVRGFPTEPANGPGWMGHTAPASFAEGGMLRTL